MASARNTNLYAVLGVPPGSTHDQIRAAYLALAVKHHPDKRPEDPTLFASITGAYGVLKDTKRRAAYDAKLKLLGGQCYICDGRGVAERTVGFGRVKTVICAVCEGTGYEEN